MAKDVNTFKQIR